MMITRALLLALACAYAAALSPLTAAGDDSDCALYLTGPGRTSAYDYSINLLKGNFGYEGQNTCITYDAINQAYLEARNRILVSQPKGDWKPEDYASVGELVLDISINLARRYGLTYEEIEKGLPLIDTSRTLIREVCPPVFSHVECRAGKYRRLDGLCNNLQHPTWGSTNSPFQRLIGPLFADGINAPRIAHTGRDLPLSRVVSRTMHPDDGFHDHAGTVMVIAWGQFMDHDYTLTGTPLDPINRNDPEECCKRPPHLKHPYCNELRIPDDDYFYRLFGVKCIDFVRGFPSPRPGCRLGSRIPFNTLTGVIDGNTVYGVTEKFARKLRTGFGGLLRMNPVFKEYGLKDLLPLKLDIPDEGCTRPNKNMYCFEAGEIRVNEQLILTVMHTLMAREHNRVARALADVNPHWDDETLYQEARRINIAEIQHITYNEFLPILLGKDVMEKFGLVLEKEGYWEGYDQEVNPDVIASFAAAAYRFGHSLLPTAVERWSKAHKFIASKRLSDLIRRPYDLYRAGVLDEYVMGLMNQVAQAMDDSITQEVTNHLFKKVGARFGMDLVSFNMQRGREFGLPGYMEFRKFCGLSGADSFQDLFGTMSNDTVRKYETIFEHPIDVDLWSGGVSERPLPGSMLGPTFACIIATQFSYSRRGDRFWFELPKQPSSFTSEQLVEIRKSRLARIICDNTDIIDTVQLYPMVLPDHELNPRVPCRSGIIPMMDFSKWAEPAPFHGPAKQFITDAIITSNNDTNSTDVIRDAGVDTNTTETCEGCNITINLNCNCNETTDPNANTQNQTADVNTQEHIKCDCLNNNDTLIDAKIIESSNDTETAKITNEAPHSNNVLKYVYNKNGDIATKSKGHFKNSLNRKKRSSDVPNSQEKTNYVKNSPVIVNYETSHRPRDIEIALPFRSDNTIRNADLADFNIETLHETANKNQAYPVNYSNNPKQQSKRREDSSERDDYDNNRENRRNNKDSDENDERQEYKQNDSVNDRYSHENNKYKQDHKTIPEDSTENRESNERHYDGNSKSTYNRPHESLESDEEAYNRGRKISHDLKSPVSGRQSRPESNSQESGENSNESPENQFKSNHKDHDEYKNEQKNITSPKIVDVDLSDFSHEIIQVNEKGEIHAAKDSHENYDINSAVELINMTTSKPDTKLENYDEGKSKEITDSSSSIEINNDSAEPININDGEVRPVVELNSDSGDGEENINSALKINESNENQSLESLLGVKETDSNEQSDKVLASKNVEDNGDVKQQFERIPLNYNHSDKDPKPNKQNTEPKTLEDEDPGTNNEGTLDTFSLPEYRYNENLNIKFDDLAIKLPEIKLPDDILAYAYDAPAYGDEKDSNAKKQKFYHYSDEQSAEQGKQKYNDKKNNEEADPGYYGSYRNYQEKDDYKKKQDDEDDEEEEEEEGNDRDEDLYEKFVRERFGKRGSFEKRSENLQNSRDLPKSPELYKTIQNILKKTENVQKEAEKSGDPKAGYMWTLEYGENA